MNQYDLSRVTLTGREILPRFIRTERAVDYADVDLHIDGRSGRATNTHDELRFSLTQSLGQSRRRRATLGLPTTKCNL